MPDEDSSVANSNPTVDVKKIVLLKRNPNNVIDNNSTQSSVISSTLISSIDLIQTPSRSGSSSPNLEVELTPEQSAHLGEIDFNTGLDGFLLAALKNPKDRLFLLKLDREMERFINDKNHTRLEFPPMNSYQRLIVHRVAQYFKLSHVVDSSGKAVVLYKSPDTQIPILRFSDLLEQEEEKPEKSVKIMRRQQFNSQSQLRSSTGDSDSNSEGERKILTIEEREAAYQKARARIFKDLEQKNEDIDQDEIEEPTSSSPTSKNSNNSNSSSNNSDQQNSSDLPSQNKPKGSQQSKNSNTNNNKSVKQSQQTNKSVGNNKNKTSVNTVKNRQQQTQRLQQINYTPQNDRSFYLPKQPRPVGYPPPMMPPGPFGHPPFFGGPHLNMYDVNMLSIQPQILPPEMHAIGNHPYINVPHDWNPQIATYGRPNVRSVWGDSFNAPPEMGGGPSLFNQQPNTGNSFLSRPAQQNDVNFASNQGPNHLKYMNQLPQSSFSQPSSAASFGETNHVINSSASPADGNSNKLTSVRDGTTSPNSPISQTGFENNNSLWKNQWGNMTSGEVTCESKSNDRQLDQKRTNNRPSTFVPISQQREGTFFNSVWNNNNSSNNNNNNSDSPTIGVFNPAQASTEFSTQNTSGLTMMPPHMFPGIVPPPISGPPSGPRRNNNSNQMFPGPMPPEHVNLQRINMMPPPIMGFPQQPGSLTGGIRPPKSSELFDPHNSSVSNSNISLSIPDATLQTPVQQPLPVTSTIASLPSRHSPPVISPKGTFTSNNKITPISCAVTPAGTAVTKVINQNHANTRRKNNGNDSSTNSNNNSVVNGTMMRSLSLSSNHSQGKNQSNHHRASSTSPSGNSKKKESGLLFDYSMQVPYEGVKPSEANEPPQPNHIIELYDFAETDNLIDIAFSNATIKRISPPQNSTNKRPTILAIFKTSREANKAMQNFKGIRFKIKTWEPLVKNNGGNVTPPNVAD